MQEYILILEGTKLNDCIFEGLFKIPALDGIL